jgi:DNA-binding XRE family transcriptional regulator
MIAAMEKIPFSKWVEQERSRRGWTMEQLAKRVGTHRITIGLTESGKTHPSPRLIRDICKVFSENPPLIPDNVSLETNGKAA